MAVKQEKPEIKDIKDALKENKLVIGSSETRKLIIQKKLSKVFVSSNIPNELLEEIEDYCEINNIELVKLQENNRELGVICKKPFNVLMVGIKL